MVYTSSNELLDFSVKDGIYSITKDSVTEFEYNDYYHKFLPKSTYKIRAGFDPLNQDYFIYGSVIYQGVNWSTMIPKTSNKNGKDNINQNKISTI